MIINYLDSYKKYILDFSIFIIFNIIYCPINQKAMKKTIPILLICLFCINWLSSQNCRLSCVSSVNVSLMPNDCQDTLSPLSFLNNPSAISPSCLAYKLVILYPFGTQKFSPANVVNQSHAGYTMKYQVFDSVSKKFMLGIFKGQQM